MYGFAGKEINDLLFLFGFNEVGTEGLRGISFSLPSCPLPSPSSPCYNPPPFTRCSDPNAGQLTKDTGWKGNLLLSRCGVWSGVGEAPGGNLFTCAVLQAKRGSPGWGVAELTGGGRVRDKHIIFGHSMFAVPNSSGSVLIGRLGSQLRPRLKRRLGIKK